MARKQVVGRTFRPTEATLLCANPETREMLEVKVFIVSKCADNAEIMKKANALGLIPEGLMPVQVISTQTSTVKKVMDAQKFYNESETVETDEEFEEA